MDRIYDALGLPRKQIPRSNTTRNKTRDWRKLYDDEMIEFVAHWHKKDIDQGGYIWE
jgi:hypothetical protein